LLNFALELLVLQEMDGSRKRVAYYYDAEIGYYHYGRGHPMRPFRITLTHNLICSYGLNERMKIYRPLRATADQMKQFHSDDYIEFLKSKDGMEELVFAKSMHRYNVGDDCPLFNGMFSFCQISAGGSLACAQKITSEEADIVINWGGGLHHARSREASGFCYVNDIVLAILHLLEYYQRVLYIDIDCHHGDGVEEAFYATNRVLTMSFHKFGEFFPGSGDINDIGADEGRYYAVNVPLRDGITDEHYQQLFEPIVHMAVQYFQPNVIVMQCGSDSLSGDRLGVLNLTAKGHGNCVEYVRSLNIPLMLVGGGGYTIKNVARCWTYETALAIGAELDNNLPTHEYIGFYAPDFLLHFAPTNIENRNTSTYLEETRNTILRNLRLMPVAPSVQMEPYRPRRIPYQINIADIKWLQVTNEGLFMSLIRKFNILQKWTSVIEMVFVNHATRFSTTCYIN
ncbi:Histone deacetylase 1, partial [Trichinella pseudospiralis]